MENRGFNPPHIVGGESKIICQLSKQPKAMVHTLPKHCVQNLAKIITKRQRQGDKERGESLLFKMQRTKLVHQLYFLGGYCLFKSHSKTNDTLTLQYIKSTVQWSVLSVNSIVWSLAKELSGYYPPHQIQLLHCQVPF